ncbi:hypothetical protein V6N11_076789 [Hibiscus sabdariffa]
MSAAKRNSPVGITLGDNREPIEKPEGIVREHGVVSPAVVTLGCAGATVAPVIGSAQGGVRTVKSVNSLVEALGSSAQQHVIATTRSRRGRGQPEKGNYPVEAGGEMVNDYLTNSDIQAR